MEPDKENRYVYLILVSSGYVIAKYSYYALCLYWIIKGPTFTCEVVSYMVALENGSLDTYL